MRVDWNSYVDNLDHQDAPGCFRCHGKLVAKDAARSGQPIDVDCDTCHYFQLK